MVHGPISCWIWHNLRSRPIFFFHVHGSHRNKAGGQTEDITDEETWWNGFSTLCLSLLMLLWKSGQSAHGGLMGRKTGGSHLILFLSHSLPALQNSIVFLLPKTTVCGDRPYSCLRLWKGKERKGKYRTQIKGKVAKTHETETNKILPICNVTAASFSVSSSRFVWYK